MAYLRKDSPHYYIRRRKLRGYGDTGRLSSYTEDKKQAESIERLLEEMATWALYDDPAWYDVLDAVCKTKTITLPQLMRAKREKKLDVIKKNLKDPHLADAVQSFEEAVAVKRGLRRGLDMLLKRAPEHACLSYLSAQTITDMCRRAENEGLKRNSVRRTLLRAISRLLRFHLGSAERNRIFEDVHFSAEDDTREVHLRPEEIARLLEACRTLGHGELETVIRLALQTSADRGVLLAGRSANGETRGLRKRDLRIYEEADGSYSGEVLLKDKKTKSRTRTVPLTDSLCRELLVLLIDKAPEAPVFSISYSQLDHLWRRVREEAGLEGVRFKDLRAQVSIYGEEAGVPQTVLARTMGHSGEAMTRRYQQRRAALSPEQAAEIERAMLPDSSEDSNR